jgi:hypothetical protein
VRGLPSWGPSLNQHKVALVVDWVVNLSVGLSSTFNLTTFMNYISVNESGFEEGASRNVLYALNIWTRHKATVRLWDGRW